MFAQFIPAVGIDMRQVFGRFRHLTLLWQRGHLRQLGVPTLVAAVALLLSAIMLLSVNVSALRDSLSWVQRSDDVLMHLYDVNNDVIGNEMSSRGYALTDDPSFLRFQREEQRDLAVVMAELRPLVARDPSQSKRFEDMRKAIAERMHFFKRLTALGPNHAKEVGEAISEPANRESMRRARLAVDAFRAGEVQLLAERQAVAARQATRTFMLAVGIVSLAFLLGGLGFAMSVHGRA